MAGESDEEIILTESVVASMSAREGGMSNAKGADNREDRDKILTGPVAPIQLFRDLGISNASLSTETGAREHNMIGPAAPLRRHRGTDISNLKQRPRQGGKYAEMLLQFAKLISEFHSYQPVLQGAFSTKEAPVDTLANGGYDENQPRLPAGQSGGGQWTSAGTRGVQTGTGQLKTVPSTVLLSGKTSELLPDKFDGKNPIQINSPKSGQNSDSSEDASPGETADSLLAKVVQAVKAGGRNPTRAQLDDVWNACDVWQKYVVQRGMPENDAADKIETVVRDAFNPGSGPNPGSERRFIFRQGEPAGADAAQIVAGAIIGKSNVPADKPFLTVKPPPGKFGYGDFGDAMHESIGGELKAKFPNVPFKINSERGQNGVDVTVLDDDDVPTVGFKYGEIKPNSDSGQRTLLDQVQRWKDKGAIPKSSKVQPITYDADGNVYFGFKLDQNKK